MAWIWLDPKKYPQYQFNYPTINGMPGGFRENLLHWHYCVAEFYKEYCFQKEIKAVNLKVSGDSFYQLYLNGELCGIGPPAAGGDFLLRNRPAPKHYYNTHSFPSSGKSFTLSSLVRLLPQVLTDYSRGRGGFFAEGTVLFADGTEAPIAADSTWLCRPVPAFTDFFRYNGKLGKGEFSAAVQTDDIWSAEAAPIPPLALNRVFDKNTVITVPGGSQKKTTVMLDKIYGVYPHLTVSGKCEITVITCESEGQEEDRLHLVFDGEDSYIGFRQVSAGQVKLQIANPQSTPLTVSLNLIAPWYPVTAEGRFETSNADYNKIYDVCRHTLKICRQSLHLDSTKHQELLACTGDYYIETLMNIYCFGDTRLSAFDVMRTADWLFENKGIMFHTTYSLIWVMMLRDTYILNGDKALLTYCLPGLEALLLRFESYKGESGVIETPPDFMFVDWTVMDGYSMHHPPKYLGQTVLNAYYYGALEAAESVYAFLENEEKVNEIRQARAAFLPAFRREFYNSEKGLFTDGKGDPYGNDEGYCPHNENKIHFSKYPNILASLFGLLPEKECADLLEKVLFDDSLQDIQPYFMHWAMCALRKYNLFGRYGFLIAERWTQVVNECDKGLKEGWIAPEPGYRFDHSHAWGGTVAYQLPAAITGMKILEPGMKKLAFAPNLYELDFANIDIPTPCGTVALRLQKGKAPVITAPEGLEIVYDKEMIL